MSAPTGPTGRRADTMHAQLARTPCPGCGARKLLIARTTGAVDWSAATCTACMTRTPLRFDVVGTTVTSTTWAATVSTDPDAEPGVHTTYPEDAP